MELTCAKSMETSSRRATCDHNKSAAGRCHDFRASAEPQTQRWGQQCARSCAANHVLWPLPTLSVITPSLWGCLYVFVLLNRGLASIYQDALGSVSSRKMMWISASRRRWSSVRLPAANLGQEEPLVNLAWRDIAFSVSESLKPLKTAAGLRRVRG